ncbi:hypothetical protein HAX54_023751 [Datura stramonium]|uniref:Uncharacterized protein n=1 Tax=Datura stramonium TaxID=4076 RepID=A0ABS8UYL7_DATST|nr:hypothetical protein [Datura stramonium]
MIDSLKVLRADGIGLNQILCTTNEWKSLQALFSSWISKPRISPEISWAFLPSSLQELEVFCDENGPFSKLQDEMLPPQGLYEEGIFSTFLPGNKIPSWFTKLENTNAVSFTISQPLNNIQGLSIAVVYTSSENQEEFSRAYWRKQENIVHNTTKELKWMHHPRVFGIQKVKELGIDLVCDGAKELSDLSSCRVSSPVIPVFSNDKVPGDVSQRGRVFKIGS